MSEGDAKPTEEQLIDALLTLQEENTKLKTILRAHGLLHMHRESLTPVV